MIIILSCYLIMLPRFRIIIYALRFNRFLKIDGTNKPVVSMDYLKTLTCANV